MIQKSKSKITTPLELPPNSVLQCSYSYFGELDVSWNHTGMSEIVFNVTLPILSMTDLHQKKREILAQFFF